MAIRNIGFAFVLMFCSAVYSQEIRPFSESVSFTLDDIAHFWDTHAAPRYGSYVGVFVDGGSLTRNCNRGEVFQSASNTSILSAFLKTKKDKYQFQFQDYGKFGKENLLLTAICGVENKSSPDYLISNSWTIYKFLKDKECFESSKGISVDQTVNSDIFVVFYTYSKYDMENKTVEYGRELPYPYCDEHEKYKAN